MEVPVVEEDMQVLVVVLHTLDQRLGRFMGRSRKRGRSQQRPAGCSSGYSVERVELVLCGVLRHVVNEEVGCRIQTIQTSRLYTYLLPFKRAPNAYEGGVHMTLVPK